jgi:hypothetical protein
MEFRIADTFTDGLARLTGAEQKAVKMTAFDLQLDPSSSALHFHRLDRARDPNFWSVRVNADVRLIVHRTASSKLSCYVGHHDTAYGWAERRRIERHPTTGAAQLVELPERVEARVGASAEAAPPLPSWPGSTRPSIDPRVDPRIKSGDAGDEKPSVAPPPLFADVADELLLGYGVPTEWLDAVRRATEDTLFDLTDHLPQEAAEALLSLATGGTPAIPAPAPVTADPFGHPDAQRRFRVLTNVEELERALDFPWEKWVVFLHPTQRQLVERSYGGPARVSGSAGTGKTIVALHHAVTLARRHPEARVLLTTFSKALANALKTRLQYLIGNEPEIAGRIEVHPVTGIAYEMYSAAFGQPNIGPSSLVRELLRQAAVQVDSQRFTERFLFSEWSDVVDAW